MDAFLNQAPHRVYKVKLEYILKNSDQEKMAAELGDLQDLKLRHFARRAGRRHTLAMVG